MIHPNEEISKARRIPLFLVFDNSVTKCFHVFERLGSVQYISIVGQVDYDFAHLSSVLKVHSAPGDGQGTTGS